MSTCISELCSTRGGWGARAAALWLIVATAGWQVPAQAHDTWFERSAQATAARPTFTLGTGNAYPTFDSANRFEHLVLGGCRTAGTDAVPLRVADPAAEALVLEPLRELPAAARVSCWAQLQPFDVDLVDELVDVYFKEAQPPVAVRQAWAALKGRGVAWTERYVKHARVEWFPDPARESAEPAAPSGMGVDALMLKPLRAPRVGDEVEFRILKDGQPLKGQAIEFRVHNSRFGLWRRTDEQGHVRLTLPSAGRWLLRGIELTPPAPEGRRWQGLFITLAFDALPPAR